MYPQVCTKYYTPTMNSTFLIWHVTRPNPRQRNKPMSSSSRRLISCNASGHALQMQQKMLTHSHRVNNQGTVLVLLQVHHFKQLRLTVAANARGKVRMNGFALTACHASSGGFLQVCTHGPSCASCLWQIARRRALNSSCVAKVASKSSPTTKPQAPAVLSCTRLRR